MSLLRSPRLYVSDDSEGCCCHPLMLSTDAGDHHPGRLGYGLSRCASLQIEWRSHKYRLKLFRRFCGDRLQDPRIAKAGAGFVTSKTPTDPAYTPHPDRDENAQLARFANLLFTTLDRRATRTLPRSWD